MNTAFKRLELALTTLTVFRPVGESPVLSSFRALLRAADAGDAEGAASRYADVYYRLREAEASGLGAYIFDLLRFDEFPFAKALITGTAEPAFIEAARRDVDILSELAGLSCAEIKTRLMAQVGGETGGLLDTLPEWETGAPLSFDALADFYRTSGCGALARYRAFTWSDGVLTPVVTPDPLRFEQLVGYEWQRRAVLDNTRALIGGRFVNNVLLYGDSGTGKSAAVKSMLTVEGYSELALIEVSKGSLTRLPELMSTLAWRPGRFILFIDDLSFEDGDKSFSALKVVLEGSLGRRPQNVAVYVTSNRRQLVRREFSDRDDLSGGETVEEKTSLADRFGLRLPFFSLNQEEYLETVTALAAQAGLACASEALRKDALQWALEHGSRTPRTARQFVDDLLARA